MASYDIIVKLVDQTKAGLRNIESGLTTIQNRAEQVNKTLDKLGAGLNKAGVIAAGALGIATKSALTYADAIQDASNASGIATGTILAFSQSVATSGGDANRAVDAMTKFADAVGNAATGSFESRKAFTAVGVSLQDLRTLSEEDLFKKTIAGLASIEDLSIRAAAQNNIFGKTLKGVDVGAFAGNLEAAAAAQQKNAEAIKSAAAVVDQLKIGYGKLEIAILKALKPLADWIGRISSDQMDRFVDAILKLGVAIVGLTAGLKVLQALGAILTGVAGAWGLFTAGAAVAGTAVVAQSFRFAAFAATVKKAWDVLMGGSAVTMTVGKVVTTVGTKMEAFRFIIDRVAQTIGLLATRFLPVFVGGLLKVAAGLSGIAGIAYGVASAIDLVFDTKIIDTFINGVKNAWGAVGSFWDRITGGKKKDQGMFLPQAEVDSEIKRLQGLAKAREAAAPKPNPYIDALVDQLAKAQEAYDNLYGTITSKDINMAALAFGEVSAAAEKLGITIQKPATLIQRDFNIALAKANEEIRQNGIILKNTANVYAEFKNELDKSGQELDKQAIRLGNSAMMNRQFEQEVRKAAQANDELAMKLNNGAVQAATYQNEINALALALKDFQSKISNAELQDAILTDELERAAAAALKQKTEIEDAATANSRFAIETQNAANAIKAETSLLGDNRKTKILFGQEQQRTENAMKRESVMLEELRNAYGANTIGLKAYLEMLSKYSDVALTPLEIADKYIKSSQDELAVISKKKMAFDELIKKYRAGDIATKTFEETARAIGAATPQIRAVTSELQTQQEKIQEYNDAIKESINSATDTFVTEFSAAFMKGEGMLDAFRNFFSNVMNDIAQRIIKKQLTEPIADALNGMLSDVMKSTGGIGSALSGIFSSAAGGGGSGFFGSIGSALGSIGSGIASALGIPGFANGGMLGAGQVGMVGENGPEFITGPANITPMDQMSGGDANPVINFTINAIDTQTGVQFLLQNKPAIVSMVSQAYNERGRRGVNG